MTKVLVTGSNGFIGRNLCLALAQRKDVEVLRYDIESTADELAQAIDVVDVIFHLAGVNRPSNVEEFKTGNADFTESLCASLQARCRTPLIVLSSSTQAELDNPYGLSKRQAEIAVENYAKECAASFTTHHVPRPTPPCAVIYRLPNVFGKGCRPNYNSAVATWCHNIANGLPIQMRDPNATVTLVYVDDVMDAFIHRLHRFAQIGDVKQKDQICDNLCNLWTTMYCEIPITYTKTLGEIASLIESFRDSRSTLQIPDQADGFTKKLYATYLSYLPVDQFSYPLKMNVDARGSFTEIFKTPDRGQVSVNISKPGIVKGNHWHHTKVEKFLVVSGKGVIRFRKLEEDQIHVLPQSKILEYFVSGDKLEVVDIPPGYTHNIENLGETDMVTVMWASEGFDPERPDTWAEKV